MHGAEQDVLPRHEQRGTLIDTRPRMQPGSVAADGTMVRRFNLELSQLHWRMPRLRRAGFGACVRAGPLGSARCAV